MSTRRQDFGPFSFEAPSAWLMRPMIVFTEPPTQNDASNTATFVLTRDYRVRGEVLLAYAWRRLFEIARDNPERRLLDRRETTMSGQVAFRAVFEWTTDDGTTMHEAIAWIDGGEDTVLVATCTASSADAQDRFDFLLASLRFPVSTPAAVAATSTTERPAPVPPSAESTGVYATVPMPGARSTRF